MKNIVRYLSAVVLLGFGLITLFLSTSIILDLFDIRAKEGNYVLFIVWANFICSILYLFSGYGFIKTKKWTTPLLGIASALLIVSFIALIVYINNGGVYETKTVFAMIFRIGVTLAITLSAYFIISRSPTNGERVAAG
ncbi:MAG: hypothetical protein IPP77_01360 [Bacteroidetes bacterium]|nr:hypothetical protein [Bacteroidota bacterium]